MSGAINTLDRNKGKEVEVKFIEAHVNVSIALARNEEESEESTRTHKTVVMTISNEFTSSGEPQQRWHRQP